jgi:argonaute-like protein implicated in RNA metabolism and viral defense
MKRDPFFDLIHLILTSEENEKKKIIKYINDHLKNKKISSSDAKALKLIYGGGLYQRLANVYRANYCDGKARPLEGNELHPLCMNYLGPYTEIDKYPDYPPYNDVDNCARSHDFAYKEAFDKPKEERQKLVREADEVFLNCIEKYKDQQAYNIGKAGIQGKINIENLLPESVDLSNYQGKQQVGLQGQGFLNFVQKYGGCSNNMNCPCN